MPLNFPYPVVPGLNSPSPWPPWQWPVILPPYVFAPPQFIDPAGPRKIFPSRRGRFFDPGQFNLIGNPYPGFTRQAQRSRLTLRRSEGQFFSPGQFNLTGNPSLPSFPRQAPNRKNLLRRSQGKFFTPGQYSLIGNPYPGFTRPGQQRKISLRRSQGKFFNQSWGQGNQGVQFPLYLRQERSSAKWGPLPRRGQWFNPGWGQGNQGTAFPLFTRQAGVVSRFTLRNPRGKFQFTEAPLPAGVTYQFAGPVAMYFPQYLGPPGTGSLYGYPGQPAIFSMQQASGYVFTMSIPPHGGWWTVNGVLFQAGPPVRKERIPEYGFSIHDAWCSECLQTHWENKCPEPKIRPFIPPPQGNPVSVPPSSREGGYSIHDRWCPSHGLLHGNCEKKSMPSEG